MAVVPSDILGGPVSSLGANLEPSIDAPAKVSNTLYLGSPYLQVTAGGTLLDKVVSAVWTQDFDARVATATVDVLQDPGGIPYRSEVVITAGQGYHNAIRFRGPFSHQSKTVWPHVWRLHCRGYLSYAAEYQNPIGQPFFGFPGLFLYSREELPPGAPFLLQGTDVPTDQNIVSAVLSRVKPSIPFDPADIQGTGRLFGQLAWREAVWQTRQIALDYLDAYDRVCLGFRLYDSVGGRVRRAQIYGYPSTTSDAAFVEGVDIWPETNGDRSIEGLINAVDIMGYAIGGKPWLIRYSPEDSQESNPFQPGTEPHVSSLTSPLIEQRLIADGNALSAQEVGTWQLTELNREQVALTLVTHRDDILAPARTIAVNSPHSGVTEPVWIRGVTGTVRLSPPIFQQTVRCTGGGISGVSPPDYVPPDVY